MINKWRGETEICRNRVEDGTPTVGDFAGEEGLSDADSAAYGGLQSCSLRSPRMR